MRTFVLEREKIYHGTLLLVNAKYPYRNDNTGGQIAVDPRFPDILLKRDAANVLQLILENISAGSAIVPVSGYRSLQEQQAIYRNSLQENGEEFTRKYVALPNHSEHQTGLAIDLGLNKADIDFICPDFPYEGICDTFRRAAPDYGFIQRYAEDKEEITGISHEPWHFRYVGYPHSKIIAQQGFSLEEYTEYIKNFRVNCRLHFTSAYGMEMEIYYLPSHGHKTLIFMPETCVYQISGNNIDGFIVTIWRKKNEQK